MISQTAECRPRLCSLNYNYSPVEKLNMYVESSLECALNCVFDALALLKNKSLCYVSSCCFKDYRHNHIAK